MNEILLIDDEEDFGYFVKANLLALNNGYHVSLATNGETGLRMADEIQPNLILLDVMMPNIDGLQVLKKLKTNEKTRNIPVIMLTAKFDDESIIQAVDDSSSMYIIKPIDMSTLDYKIQSVLRNHRLGLHEPSGNPLHSLAIM